MVKTEDQVWSILVESNPAPDANTFVQDESDGAAYLATLEPRSSEMAQLDYRQTETEDDKNRMWAFAVAAIAVLILGVVVILSTQGGDSDPVAPQPSDTTVAFSQSFTEQEALAFSTTFIEAFNAGNAETLLSTITPEASLSETYTGMSADSEPIDPAFFEQYMAWTSAQGSTLTTPDCAVTERRRTQEVTVVCEFGWLNAAEEAAGASPVPTVLTMIATPDGFTQLAFEYPAQFGVADFDDWVLTNYPNNRNGVDYGDWESVADAEQGGLLRAQYASEWAAQRDANN